MSKTPTAVFKATNPALIDAYEQRTTELWAEYRETVKALQQEWGVEQLSCRGDWNGGQFVTGYVPEDRNEEPKPGFRKDRDSGFMVPAKRTAEGKAIVQRIKDVHYKPGKKPGLPGTIMGEGFMGPMVIQKLNGTWYAYCTVPLRTPGADGFGYRGDDLREVDRELWEPVKLSAYFLDAEAQEAADAVKEDTDA
jgi:hypothetical protein